MQALFCTGIAFLPRSIAWVCSNDEWLCSDTIRCRSIYSISLDVSPLFISFALFEEWYERCNTSTSPTLSERFPDSSLSRSSCKTLYYSLPYFTTMYSTKSIHKNINPNYRQTYTSTVTHTTEMESDYPGGGRKSNSSHRNTQRMQTMASLSNWSTNQTLTRRYLSSTPRRSHWTQENWGLDLATYQNRANLHVTRQLNVTAASWNKKTSCSSCIEMIPRKRNFSGSRRTLLCLQGTGMEENWKVWSSCLTLGDLASRHTIQTVPTIAFTIYPSTPRSNSIGKGTIQLGG